MSPIDNLALNVRPSNAQPGPENPAHRAACFYRCALPAMWLCAALISWQHPGDEYLLFVLISGLPGAWTGALLGSIRLPEGLPVLLGAGLATMTLVGWLLDALRIRRTIWLALFVCGTIVLVWYALYPDPQAALAKNGSLTAYTSAATNLSLYLSALLCSGGALLVHILSFVRRSFKKTQG